MLTTEVFTTDVEYNRIVKHVVESTQHGIVLVEVIVPLVETLVTGGHKVVGPFLVVPAIDYVEEQACVLFVKFAVANLIYYQAGWPDKSRNDGSLFAKAFGC